MHDDCSLCEKNRIDALEMANHQAAVDYLMADARAQGLEVVMVGVLGRDDETFMVKTQSGAVLTLTRADLALFLVEEKLVKAGVIR